MSQSEEGICVVEFRDSDGNVIHFEVRVIAIVELMQTFCFTDDYLVQFIKHPILRNPKFQFSQYEVLQSVCFFFPL